MQLVEPLAFRTVFHHDKAITLIWLSIDSPNTQKEFPPYHKLKSNNFWFRAACSIFFLHVHILHSLHHKAFMLFFFIRPAIDSTKYDNEMDESFVAGKMNILWTKFLKFRCLNQHNNC